jgi:L-lactate permease
MVTVWLAHRGIVRTPTFALLGSFFAGSCTISNLTFGPIQNSIAMRMGLDRTTILALQSVGGARGNRVAIHNTVAVCSVLGSGNAEGAILKKTLVPMLVYGAIAAIMQGGSEVMDFEGGSSRGQWLAPVGSPSRV